MPAHFAHSAPLGASRAPRSLRRARLAHVCTASAFAGASRHSSI
jgi:hypothetical protein